MYMHAVLSTYTYAFRFRVYERAHDTRIFTYIARARSVTIVAAMKYLRDKPAILMNKTPLSMWS